MASAAKSTQEKMMEFFDEKENWKEETIKVGRPWKLDELRLKSNADLHKLWYVLLKERNMILTMEEEYKRLLELMPSPERLEKVEESMENIMEVVAERDRAYNLLEKGETGEPELVYRKNEIGLMGWKPAREYRMPKESNPGRVYRERATGPWINKYLRLFREKRLRKLHAKGTQERKEKRMLRKMYP